jgi:hypothetical protein
MIKELYISVDIEADGPIPGRDDFSMISLGAVVAGYKTDTGEIEAFDVTAPENRFYVELKPISENWNREAMQVGVFTGFSKDDKAADPSGEKLREYLMTEGEDAVVAMTRFNEWLRSVKSTHNAKGVVFAAYPLGFDFTFVHWYMTKFSTTQSQFGFSRHVDIKTVFSERSGNLIIHSTKRNMPKFLHSTIKHTHLAIDDAAGQGELLMNLYAWDGKRV